MRYKWFPKSIINAYFKYTEYNKLHIFVAYKYFDYFLKNYCLLNLNIKEKEDFDFEDIDQIKAKKYYKEYLIKGGYSLKYSNLETIKMDKWNLHTFTNHGVIKSKIKLCYINKSYKMVDILYFLTKNTKIDLNDVCPDLYKYLTKRKYI